MKKVLLLVVCMLTIGSLAWAQATTPPSLGMASAFAVLSAPPAPTPGAVTCTGSSITGAVGSSGPPASIVQTGCTITGATFAPVSGQVVTDFNTAYTALAALSCDMNLTGNLAGVTLPPGVYCFPAAATLTGTLTLLGPSTGIWIFKIGTLGTGALTGTDFSVVMSGGGLPCNVFWWVAQAATMTNSTFVGTILAGAAITSTGGPTGKTLVGRALAKAGVTLTGTTVTDTCLGQPSGHGGDDDNDHQGCHDDRDSEHRDGDKDHHDEGHHD